MKADPITTLDFEFGQMIWTAHSSGALYSKKHNCILIADVHLGKVSHFRKHGAAVPTAAIQSNFDQLNEVLAYFNTNTVYFLGDLFHSHSNKEWDYFASWINTYQPDTTLVLGNHDIIPLSRYDSIGIKTCELGKLDAIQLTHIPEEDPEHFTISGHIHPGVRLRGVGRQSLSLPCFFASGKQLILPAFGSFTGKHILRPKSEDRIYAIAEGALMALHEPL